MKHHLLIMERRGIGIHLHWSWLVLLGFSLGLGLYEGWVVALLLGSLGALLLAHELGHALLARCCHCPVQAIVLHPLHGRCLYELPGDELEALREAVIAWGGVLAQGLLLIPAGAALLLWGWDGAPFLNALLLVLGPVNGAMLVLNLAPTPGLDGHCAWRLPGLLRHYHSPAALPAREAPPPAVSVGLVVEPEALEPDATDLYHMLWLKCLYDRSRVAQLLAQEQRRHPHADPPELLKHALRRFDRKLEDG